MAETQSQIPGWKKTLRIALIPVLGVALLAVCFWPDAQNDSVATDQADNPPTEAENLPQQPAKQADNARASGTAARKQTTPVTLSHILEHDPFALPPEVGHELLLSTAQSEEEAASEERERIEDMIETLQQEKLNVVFRGKEGVWARLGDRIVHEGDELEPGIRILKITSQGLTLEVSEDFEREPSEID